MDLLRLHDIKTRYLRATGKNKFWVTLDDSDFNQNYMDKMFKFIDTCDKKQALTEERKIRQIVKSVDYTVDCHGFFYDPEYKEFHDYIHDTLIDAGFGAPRVKAYKQSGTLL